MTELSRRTFLRLLAASLGSLGGIYLSGCLNQDKLLTKSLLSDKITPTPFPPSLPADQISSPEVRESTNQPEDTPVPTISTSYPALAVARNGDPEEMVRKAVAALGGMSRYVKSGDVVVIKPNICVSYHSYEYAATTNPWVVAGVVKLALEAGAKLVKVMDAPFGGTAEQAYKVSGIQAEVNKAGGKMVVMSQLKYAETAIPQGVDLKTTRIYDEVLNADVLINIPIAKNHELALLTLGMKNLMGVIADRPMMHAYLGQRLADLNSRVRSNLVIIDAVRMLMKHGPTGGNLSDVNQANTIVASADIVAADSYAATLFGYRPDDLDYIKKGAKLGLGVKDLDSLKIEEINLG